jgi:hypothetical protein
VFEILSRFKGNINNIKVTFVIYPDDRSQYTSLKEPVDQGLQMWVGSKRVHNITYNRTLASNSRHLTFCTKGLQFGSKLCQSVCNPRMNPPILAQRNYVSRIT